MVGFGSGPESTSRAMSVQIDGKRVALTTDGLERARRERSEVGEKIAGAVRQAVDRATES